MAVGKIINAIKTVLSKSSPKIVNETEVLAGESAKVSEALEQALSTKSPVVRRIVEARATNVDAATMAAEQAEAAKKLAEMKDLMMKNEITLVPTNDVELFAAEGAISFQHDFNTQCLQPNVDIRKTRILPFEDVKACFEQAGEQGFWAFIKDKLVGGVLVNIDDKTRINHIDNLLVDPDLHSCGIGLKLMKMIEQKFPNTVAWELWTPHYSVRNIHFYLQKCGYNIVEFFNKYKPMDGGGVESMGDAGNNFFRFLKIMKPEEYKKITTGM